MPVESDGGDLAAARASRIESGTIPKSAVSGRRPLRQRALRRRAPQRLLDAVAAPPQADTVETHGDVDTHRLLHGDRILRREPPAGRPRERLDTVVVDAQKRRQAEEAEASARSDRLFQASTVHATDAL